MSGAVVLLSGGQDSTTCLAWAAARWDRIIALSIDYGQRHRRELEASAKIARHLVCEYFPVTLDLARSIPSALTTGGDIAASGEERLLRGET